MAALGALAATPAPPAPPAGPPAKAVSGALTAFLKGFQNVFKARISTLDEDLLLLFQREFPEESEQVLDQAVALEMRYERIFQQRQLARVKRDLRKALQQTDPEKRRLEVAQILDREKRFMRLREEALQRRLAERVKFVRTKLESPQGAYWKLSPDVKEHTLDCLVMGEKWWPWEVLDKVNPGNRHHGCACELIGLDRAQELGLIRPELLPNPKDAAQRARRYAQDVPELAALKESEWHEYVRDLQEARDVVPGEPDVIPDMHGALREMLRWPEGFSKGGQFRPRRGGSPGRRVLRGNLPHLPETPDVSRTAKRGRRVPIKGRLRFIPEQADWERTEDGVRFHSPVGGTNVYRNGELVSEPGRRGLHPDVRRSLPAAPRSVAAIHDRTAEHVFLEAELGDSFNEGTRRAEHAARVLEQDVLPVEVGQNSLDIFRSLRGADFHQLDVVDEEGGGTTARWLHPYSGALVVVTSDLEGASSVEWYPDGLPHMPAQRLDRPPESVDELIGDMMAWQGDLGDRFGAQATTAGVLVDTEGTEFSDHAGKHGWDQVVHLGEDVPASVVPPEVPDELRPYGEDRNLYATYRLAAHELSHGVNAANPLGYDHTTSVFEEALTEESSTVLSVERMRQHHQDAALQWLRDNPDDLHPLGGYPTERLLLEAGLSMSGIPPELWEDAIFDLKFRVPAEQRPALIRRMIAENLGINEDDAGSRMVEVAAKAVTARRPFAPLLAADLRDIPSSETDEPGFEVRPGVSVAPGDLISVSNLPDNFRVVEANSMQVVVANGPQRLTVRPAEYGMINHAEESFEFGGRELKSGDEFEYQAPFGSTRSKARVLNVRRGGTEWEVEAVTLDDSAKPDQVIVLTRDRITPPSKADEKPIRMPLPEWQALHSGLQGDSAGDLPQAPLSRQAPGEVAPEMIEELTGEVMKAVAAHGPADMPETHTVPSSRQTYRLHGGTSREDWYDFIAENAVNGKYLARIRAAQEENRANPLWSQIEEKWGPDAALPIGGEGWLHGSLFNHPDATRRGPVTFVYMKMLVVPPEDRFGHIEAKPGIFGSLQLGTAAALRHEYAHSLWDDLGYSFQSDFYKSLPVKEGANPEDTISGQIDFEKISHELTNYAGGEGQSLSPKAEEVFTELVAVGTDPNWNPARWPDWVVNLRDDVVKRLRKGPGLPKEPRSEPPTDLVRPWLEMTRSFRTDNRLGRQPTMRGHGYEYEGVEDLVLREGEPMAAGPDLLPEKYQEWDGAKKECFTNAFHLAVDNPELTYVEGYATTEGMPMAFAHAWVVDKDGNVIDPTWNDERDPSTVQYLGVRVPRDVLIRATLNRGSYGIFQDWERGYPLLKQPWKKTLKDYEETHELPGEPSDLPEEPQSPSIRSALRGPEPPEIVAPPDFDAWADDISFEHGGLRLEEVERKPILYGGIPYGGSIQFRIKTAAGENAGFVLFHLEQNTLTGARSVHISNMRLKEEYRGAGFASALLPHLYDTWREQGIESTSLVAVQVGSYAWARAGYVFDGSSPADILYNAVVDGQLAKVEEHLPPEVFARFKTYFTDGTFRYESDIASWGREYQWEEDGQVMWPGKAVMLNNEWIGKLEL